jgi:hypothetical protein
MIALEVGSSHCNPKVMVPRQTRDTFNPVRPNRVISTSFSLNQIKLVLQTTT